MRVEFVFSCQKAIQPIGMWARDVALITAVMRIRHAPIQQLLHLFLSHRRIIFRMIKHYSVLFSLDFFSTLARSVHCTRFTTNGPPLHLSPLAIACAPSNNHDGTRNPQPTLCIGFHTFSMGNYRRTPAKRASVLWRRVLLQTSGAVAMLI